MSVGEGEIETKRLRLIPAKRKFAAQMFELMRDPRVTEFLAWEPHRSAEETGMLFDALETAWDAGTGYHWIIFEDSEARGIISLIDVRRQHRVWTLNRAEIAYWVAPQAQGRGLATEATRAVIACAFERFRLHRLAISHVTTNAASGRIPQKLGFRFVGTERQFFMKNGVWHDMNHYELLEGDWNGSV